MSREVGRQPMGDNSNSVLNVCFHGIGTPRRELDTDEDMYWAGTDQFLAILDEIATWPSVQISFDDSNESDALTVLPALLERGLTAQFFIVAGRLGTPAFLAVDHVREMVAKGMSIGTHGMSHRPWLEMTKASRQAELIDARRVLEDVVGGPVTDAACPMGRYNRRLLADLRELGYQRVYTSDRMAARRESWLQPRFSVRREDSPASMRAAVLTKPGVSRWVEQSVKGFVKQLR